MTISFRTLATGLLIAGATATASGAVHDFSGSLADPRNGALVGSDLSAAAFTDEYAIALNVALYDFDVLAAGTVKLTGTGYGAGGLDPYLSLFAGSGRTAVFVASNDGAATYADFTYSGLLAAGHYRLAIGDFENMSYAENTGSGSLGDGFVMLGVPSSLGNTTYHVSVTTPVPEPAPFLLFAAGGVALALTVRRRS